MARLEGSKFLSNMRIALICTANVARSVMAESIFRSILREQGRDDIEIFSAGVKDYTGIPPIDKAVQICQKFGTPVCKEGATFIEDIDIESMDWVLAMQVAHIAKLRQQANLDNVRVGLLGEFSPFLDEQEIIDPMGKRLSVFEKCYRHIEHCIQWFLKKEIPLHRSDCQEAPGQSAEMSPALNSVVGISDISDARTKAQDHDGTEPEVSTVSTVEDGESGIPTFRDLAGLNTSSDRSATPPRVEALTSPDAATFRELAGDFSASESGGDSSERS